jgi:hypothetical protein
MSVKYSTAYQSNNNILLMRAGVPPEAATAPSRHRSLRLIASLVAQAAICCIAYVALWPNSDLGRRRSQLAG